MKGTAGRARCSDDSSRHSFRLDLTTGPDNTRLRGRLAIDFDLARENQRTRFAVEILKAPVIFRVFRAVLGERGAKSFGVLFRITPI
jgi:hypothetical protein